VVPENPEPVKCRVSPSGTAGVSTDVMRVAGGDATGSKIAVTSLLPVIVQEAQSLEVLMLGYTNERAWLHTLDTGFATFWSSSRNCLWVKGETSGDYLKVLQIRIDCDQDCILYQVERLGAGACHTKNARGDTRISCFYRSFVPQTRLLKLLDDDGHKKGNDLQESVV